MRMPAPEESLRDLEKRGTGTNATGSHLPVAFYFQSWLHKWHSRLSEIPAVAKALCFPALFCTSKLVPCYKTDLCKRFPDRSLRSESWRAIHQEQKRAVCLRGQKRLSHLTEL